MSDMPPPTTSLVPQSNSGSPIRGDPVWNAVPVPLTPLLGRDREIEKICGLLDADGPRLLTLTGPGGVGKTRLAIAAATQVAPEFAHGACFVTLDSIRDPHLVAGTVAHAIGIQVSGQTLLQDTLMSAPRDRHLLLVLDNVEHVVSGVAPWLADLFVEWPLLHVLVTSRIAVQVNGEQRFVVPPLPLPTCHTNEGLSGNPAVMLFSQRARAVNPDFILTAAHAGVVAEICHRLDGFPLAIEQAASRIAVLSPPAILTRLSDRLSVLSSHLRDAPERHQTMREAIAWSYDLLSPVEQALFRRLSVFVGGFTVDAAEAVGGPMTLDLLTVLIDHSLMQRLPPQGEEARMEMYETIRQFALEQLIAHGEETAVRDAHAAYFLQMAVNADGYVRRHTQLGWLARLDEDQENLSAAIAWLARRGRSEDALKLAIDTMWLHWVRGLVTESRELRDNAWVRRQVATRSGGRATALGRIQQSAPLVGDLSRARLATRDTSAVDADLLSLVRFAVGNAASSTESTAGLALHLQQALREGMKYLPSPVSPDAPLPPRAADSPMGLTPRELDVLRLMADGLTNQEIADTLFISLRTVTSHVTHVLSKLALTSRTAAVSYAIRQGLI